MGSHRLDLSDLVRDLRVNWQAEMNQFWKYAEAHVAIVGAACTFVATYFPNGDAAIIAGGVSAFLTALGVGSVAHTRQHAVRRK